MIEKVIDTLASPEAWTRDYYARTDKGLPIGPHTENAKCFCIQGAIIRSTPADERLRAFALVQCAIREMFPGQARARQTIDFNDHPDTTHEEVLLVLRRARELELAGA